MTSGGGLCSLKLSLPSPLRLVEAIPSRFALPGARFDYYVFIEGKSNSPLGKIKVELSAVGYELIEGQVSLADVEMVRCGNSYEYHSFLLDRYVLALDWLNVGLPCN